MYEVVQFKEAGQTVARERQGQGNEPRGPQGAARTDGFTGQGEFVSALPSGFDSGRRTLGPATPFSHPRATRGYSTHFADRSIRPTGLIPTGATQGEGI